jgi:hypothetical protein
LSLIISSPAVLEELIAPVSVAVNNAALDRPGWSAAQFADAALLLLNSTFNAVTKQRMEIQLGRHVTHDVNRQQLMGMSVLAALVKAGRLSLRPMSDWAVDIPVEAGFAFNDILVAAPSAIDLHCMDAIRPQLMHTLELWQQRK